METPAIDSRLQRYTAAEHRIGANLQELEQHSVYQLLTTDVLTGATAKALRKAIDADPDLWALFTLLGSTLDRARRLRGTGSKLSKADRTELAELLQGSSVLVMTEDVPLGERGLTGPAVVDQRITIEELLGRMSALYEPIRDTVTHAETVLRSVLPRLNSAEATVNRLREQAASLQLQTVELDRIDETIAKVRDLSLTDPLSIPVSARDDFDSALHDASARIAAARASHDELASDIAASSDLLDECRDLIEQANQARAESLVKIAQPIGLRRAPSAAAIDGPQGLGPRLAPILSSTKPWQAIRSDIDTWNTGARRFRDQLIGVVEANTSALKKRDELRGRLAAFRAKMAATGKSEDPVLADISAEAHNELFTSPTDVVRRAAR